ncbi:hypothetical protein NKG94_27760 [Micromonospora sp. M12]
MAGTGAGASLAASGDLPGAVKQLGELVDRLRSDGFAGHEVHVLHDLVRLDQAGMAIGPTCSDGGRRTVAQRSPSSPSGSTACCRR